MEPVAARITCERAWELMACRETDGAVVRAAGCRDQQEHSAEAEAICEASARPNMRCVATNVVEKQVILLVPVQAWICQGENRTGQADAWAIVRVGHRDPVRDPHDGKRHLGTTLVAAKRFKTSAEPWFSRRGNAEVTGYEIYEAFRTVRRWPCLASIMMKKADGTLSEDGQILATYLHEVFDAPQALVSAVLGQPRRNRGTGHIRYRGLAPFRHRSARRCSGTAPRRVTAGQLAARAADVARVRGDCRGDNLHMRYGAVYTSFYLFDFTHTLDSKGLAKGPERAFSIHAREYIPEMYRQRLVLTGCTDRF